MAIDLKTNVDDIWLSLGNWGRFQTFQLFFGWFTIWPCAFHLLDVVFIGFRPNHQCAEIGNISKFGQDIFNKGMIVTYEKCKIKVYDNHTNGTDYSKDFDCVNGQHYSMPKDATFVTEMDLVCDRAGLAELTQTMLMVGQGFGASIASSLSDRYGRKKINLISHISLFLVGIGVSFANSYTMFIVLRFVTGMLQQGMAMSGAVLALEYVPTESRYVIEVMGLLFWTTGVCIIAPVGYLLRNHSWRYLHLTLTFYSAYSLVQYWIQEESVRWLLINGKIKEAERIIKKAARWNDIKYTDVLQKINMRRQERETLTETDTNHHTKTNSVVNNLEINFVENVKKKSVVLNHIDTSENYTNEYQVERYTILTILKDKKMLINSLILWFAWITNSLTYFGLTLTSTALAGNRYLNYFLSGAVEYIACALELFMLRRFGRRTITIIFHVVTGASLILATVLHYFADGNNMMITFSAILTFAGKMAITGSFSTIFLYTPELYPTNLRSVGIGSSSAAARIGGMLAPFAGILATYIAWGPGTVFASMCVIVSVLVLYLPETRGVELPSTLTELKAWYKENSGTTTRKQQSK